MWGYSSTTVAMFFVAGVAVGIVMTIGIVGLIAAATFTLNRIFPKDFDVDHKVVKDE